MANVARRCEIVSDRLKTNTAALEALGSLRDETLALLASMRSEA